MKNWKVPSLIVVAVLAQSAHAQSVLPAIEAPAVIRVIPVVSPEFTYERPTQAERFRNFAMETIGPFPVLISALEAGLDQSTNTPPEWKQGMQGYGKRFGSNLGITSAGAAAFYVLTEARNEDGLYYRCECRGILPRLGHSVFSTATARRGMDGHRVFSIAGLVAPYAGNAAALYGWYPGRFGPKDVFRSGNYSLLEYVGGNIALEFLYSGPRTLISRMHLNNPHGAEFSGQNR